MSPRSIVASSSAITASASASNIETTPYNSLEHALGGQAVNKLKTLDRVNNTVEIDRLWKEAMLNITECVYQINDHAAQSKGTPQHDQRLTEANQKNIQLEKSTRHLIDRRKELSYITASLHQAIAEQTSQNPSIQAARTQRHAHYVQQEQRSDDSEEGEDDNDEGGGDPMTGTDINASGQTQIPACLGPSKIFTRSFKLSQDNYQLISLQNRYSEQADYVTFKRNAWEGNFPNGNGPPVPPASTWFSNQGALLPGATVLNGDDDDLQTIGATISTFDPLSLLEIKDPVKSTKCPHHFDKTTITEHIKKSTRGLGPKTVLCPVTGCDKHFGLDDLAEDPALISQIKRKIAADKSKAAHANDSIDIDDPTNKFGAIDDDYDEIDSEKQHTSGRVKAELQSSRY